MNRTLVVASVAALALTLVACSESADAGPDTAQNGELTTVTVGLVASTNVAPIYLGDEQGFFEEHGIDLDLRQTQGFSENVASVSNGETQIGFGTTVPILGAISNNVPIRLIAHSDVLAGAESDISGIFVHPDSDISTITDLDGRTVAVNALSNVHDVALKAALTEGGGDPSSIQFLEVALPDMAAALETKRVDAIAVGEPFVTTAREAGNVMIAQTFTAGFAQGVPIASYFGNTQWLADNPELVAAFREALQKSSEYAAANPDDVRAIMETYTQISPDVLAEVELGAFESTIDEGALDDLVGVMVSTGAMAAPVPAADLVAE